MKCSEFTNLTPRYLAGELLDPVLEDFEKHYFTCDRCFSDLEVEEKLINKEFTVKTDNIIPLRPRRAFRPLAAAASLALVAVLYFLLISNAIFKQKLYRASQFTAPPFITSESRNLGHNSAFQEAMTLYNRGDYGRALAILKRITPGKRDMRVVFFQGICHLLKKDHRAAVRQFDIIIQEMNPSYYDEAIYYKAIALLRQGEIAQAQELLYNLTDMLSPFAPKSRVVLENIKNL